MTRFRMADGERYRQYAAASAVVRNGDVTWATAGVEQEGAS
jgi:hypothetical protein